MKIKLLERFIKLLFPNKVGSAEDELGQEEEHTIDDSTLLLTFRLNQMFGLQPILINKINSKIHHVNISSVMYLLNILICVIINGIFFYAVVLSLILSKDTPRGFIGYSSYDETNDILIAIAVIPLSVVSIFSTMYGTVRVRCIFHCLKHIKKVNGNVQIKQDINKLPHEDVANRRMKYYLIIFATFCPFLLVGCGTWLIGSLGFSTWVYHVLVIMVVLLEIQFLVLVELLNSLFCAINMQLNEVLSQLNFDYTTTTRRAVLALQIHHLLICFVESCNMLTKINRNESFLLLCHIIIFPLHILTCLYYLFYAILKTEYDPLQPFLIIYETFNTLYHVFKTIFIIQPCHQTQEEVDETKLLVAELMCHLQSEDDPLFESVDTFYKQLMLNNYTFTAMGISDIGSHLLSKIAGLAITLFMVIQF